MTQPETADFAHKLRTNYRALIPNAGAPDPVADVREVLVPARSPERTVPVRAYRSSSEAEAALPVVVFVHGGGFVSGDLDTHDVLTRAIAGRAGALVLSVDYRLAPEHPFPAGVDDVVAVLDWAAEHAGSLGGDPSRIAVSGDSAGGNLAASAAMIARDRGGPDLSAQLLMYPSLSNKMDTPSWDSYGVADTHFPNRTIHGLGLAAYVPDGTSPFDPLVAPLWGEHGGLPPTLIQVGGHDPLRDECTDYAAALESAGVAARCRVYPGEEHGFIQFFKDRAAHPRGEEALQDAVAFLTENLSMRQ
ncbi:alpha/beta hydrolase [Streptomyces diastatochromogenes]|nr:alpha/beta hydrolase [Streptomyces diastatochromogenes]